MSWKSTCVMLAKSPITQTEYVVGSGIYDLRMEKGFMVQAVEDAAKLILKKGTKKAFKLIESKGEEFFYKNTYVFVTNQKGDELANPVFPEIDRRDIWNIQDMERNFVFKEFVKIAKSKSGNGWFASAWPPDDPNSSIPKYVITYIKSIVVDKKMLITGTSVPLDDF